MPGRSSDSRPLQAVGAVVALLAVVGSTVLGWEFSSLTDPVPLAVGVCCGILAVVAARRR